jgi:hypothetical protein
VLACFNMAIPYLMPELPQAQARALQENVKAPLVYTKVLVRNWRRWVKLGVHEISAPMSFHCRVKLDYPSASDAIGMRAIRPSRCACISCMCRTIPILDWKRATSSASAA